MLKICSRKSAHAFAGFSDQSAHLSVYFSAELIEGTAGGTKHCCRLSASHSNRQDLIPIELKIDEGLCRIMGLKQQHLAGGKMLLFYLVSHFQGSD